MMANNISNQEVTQYDKRSPETLHMTREQIEDMLYHMLQICKKEGQSKQLDAPFEDFVKRVSCYTQISEYLLEDLYSRKVASVPDKEKFLDIETQIKVYKMIIKFYSEKHMPTYETLFEELKHDEIFNDFEEFKQKLALMGLRYQTIINESVLLGESQEIIYDRYNYLNQMRKCRARKATIYYVDERLIDEKLTSKKPWKENIDVLKDSSKYLFFYAVSKRGYKSGLFCNQATPNDFSNWVVNILLPELDSSSVIVLDNSPLHGTETTRSLSMNNTKQEILNWLLDNSVPHSTRMSKAELYRLVTLESKEDDKVSLDQIIQANGYQVLRLPTNLLGLSPVHLMWEELKTSLLTPLLDPLLYENKDEIHAQLMSMPNEKFEEFDQKIESMENQLTAIEKDLVKSNDKVLHEIYRLNNHHFAPMEQDEPLWSSTENITE